MSSFLTQHTRSGHSQVHHSEIVPDPNTASCQQRGATAGHKLGQEPQAPPGCTPQQLRALGQWQEFSQGSNTSALWPADTQICFIMPFPWLIIYLWYSLLAARYFQTFTCPAWQQKNPRVHFARIWSSWQHHIHNYLGQNDTCH